MKAIINNDGCGLPNSGHYVPGTDDCLWLVVDVVTSAYSAQCVAEVDFADWDSVDEGDVFPATSVTSKQLCIPAVILECGARSPSGSQRYSNGTGPLCRWWSPRVPRQGRRSNQTHGSWGVPYFA